MTRLLVLTPDFPPAVGGIQLLLGRLVEQLAPSFQITIVTRRAAGAARERGRRSASPSVLPTLAGERAGLLEANARGVGLGARHGFDVVLSAHITTAPAAAALQRLRGTPFVQYLYADEVPHRPRLARFAVRRAACTIAISSHTRALALAAGCRADRLRIVPPGVDVPPATTACEKLDRPTVITVARLEERYKGHDVMLRALPRIRERVPDVLWVVVGDGRLREELEGEARRLGLTDHVRFAGSVSDAERDRWLARAHVFAMPSRLPPTGQEGGEGFGIVYLEAGMHRLPVVAGAVGGALDAVVDDVTGLLVEPTSSTQVADAVNSLLLDGGRAQTLGKAGERHARGFSWERMGRDVGAILYGSLRAR